MPIAHTVMDGLTKCMNLFHKGVLKLSGGRFGYHLLGMQAVELHTTGRRSGKRRTVMLTSPIYEERRVVLIASKGGDDRHPDWYTNLVADPNVELTTDGVTRPMRARTASATEKAAMWPDIVAAYRGYGAYQKRTERDIPVVICEPR